jgi:hypothetical protein
VTARRPTAPIRWCGIDYGETIMNPMTLHQSAVIREIYRELGRAAEAEDVVKRWYSVRATMGPPSTAPHLLVRDLKQYARDRIATEVFDGDGEVLKRYEVEEVMAFAIPDGVEAGLKLLRSRNVGAAIVSESASLTGVQTIARFLKARAFDQYFQEIITPAGRFSIDAELLDPAFVGATKKAGTIYGKVREYLKTKDIPSSSAAIIGDDPQLDVEHSKPYGFFGIQYTGVIDRGGSEKADFAMKDWNDLGQIL